MNGTRSHPASKRILTGMLGLTWLCALGFYWMTDPTDDPLRHIFAGILLSYLLFWGVVFLWGDASPVEWTQRFLLTSMAVLLAVGLLEALVVMRLVDFRVLLDTPITEPWSHPGNVTDSTLLHIHKPHDRLVWGKIDYRYDRYGLRNETDQQDVAVIVVGDSFVEGLGVSADDLLTRRLAARLDRPVANVGQAWYGPQQELELLRRYGLALHPEVCVWTFFEGNDLEDVARYDEATRDWESFSRALHSFPQRSFTRNALLAVRRLLDRVRSRGGTSDAEGPGITGTFRDTGGREHRMYFWYKGHDLSSSDREALERMRAILARADRLCRARGADFLVAFAPTKFRVYSGLAEFEPDAEPRYWVTNELSQRLEQIVREDLPGAKFLDLTPALREAAAEGELVYFDYDSHWSPAGHRVVAEAIAAEIAGSFSASESGTRKVAAAP